MFHHPYVFVLAIEPGRRLAHSAMPDAPVVPDRPRPPRRTRRRLALTLHRLADRLQPA